ncbi:MAG TPA: hypothetical protein VGD43_06045 [Micromonospora sp.]
MPSPVQVRPLNHSVDWIPPGRYFVPVVAGLAAYWTRRDPPPGSPVAVTVHEHGCWVPARPHVVTMAVERVVADPSGHLRAYGLYTGFCGVCGDPLGTDRARQTGVHPHCGRRPQVVPPDTALAEQARACRQVLGRLTRAWTSARRRHRVRALVNAGPTAVEKVNDVTLRLLGDPAVAAGHRAQGPVTSRTDPRLPELADQVADQVAALPVERLAEAFGWAGLDTMRHLIADLGSRWKTRQLCVRVDTPADAEPVLADAAMTGRILYAHLSCRPGLLLTATVAA